VIGDRASDVKTALKMNGIGILVPFKNQLGQIEKTRKIKSENKYIAKNFLAAVKLIINIER